ncbi:MAG: ribonucleoside triphosphate reductase [bacterium]
MTSKIINLIRKRDGRLQEFQTERITDAIYKAFEAVGRPERERAEEVARRVCATLAIFYKGDRIPAVEEVQDLVEEKLVEMGYAEIAKAYILYRDQHAKFREAGALLKDIIEIVDKYVDKNDWRINENSNMDYSLQGLNNYIATSVVSKYWLSKIYPQRVREAHEAGMFHVHDLGLLSVYCCGWDLQQLLIKGFQGAFGKVASSPPKHFRSALGQIVNFFYTMQGESAGAQAFSNFDTLMAPFIRYDGLTFDEVKQAMQGFIFNLNIPTRVGFQTPFTNLTMDLQPCPTLADQRVIVGGIPLEETYSEFQPEMDLINRAFAEVMMEGDAFGRIFTFPIPTYNLTRDFDWDNPKLDSLWQMTSKFGIPYFANFINSDMQPEDARSMCCRLRLDKRELLKRGGGLFGANPLTGSIGVVTINLPRAGYISNSDEEFFANLDNLLDLARLSLDIKRKRLEQFTEQSLYPYSRFYLAEVKERAGHYWAYHFSTIGLIGMHECCMNYLGVGIETAEGLKFAGRVLDHMRARVSSYQEESKEGILYNLEATPGEGTSYRLARLDREKFNDIITSGDDGEPYYTNSSQLPVGATDDIFEALEHQDSLQAKYTGGTVLHGFIGERIEDIELCKKIVRNIANRFKLPYFTITPTFTICPVHGYISGEHFDCPYEDNIGHDPHSDSAIPQPAAAGANPCKARTEVYSRIVGYFRPVQQWNLGKQQEFHTRRTYMIDPAIIVSDPEKFRAGAEQETQAAANTTA